MTYCDQLFPQGHATGKAFCNRVRERKELAHYMENSEHVVVVAPRRYGKSSLIKQVLIDTNLIGVRIDLLPATNAHFVTKAIKKAFGDITSQILPKTEKAKLGAIKFVKSLHPKLKLSLFGQSLEVSITDTPENSSTDLLMGLDAIARKVKKKIVICFDEFQQISELKKNHSLEASIRHAVETSTNISYIFSGSSRHLLSQMFNSKSRPLYRLCDLMEIDRISTNDYMPIMARRFKSRWNKKIEENVIEEVFSLTKCHPYYVNGLCRRLWRETKAPEISSIQEAWLAYIDSQKKWMRDDLARLTPNQRNILATLAFFPTEEPFSKEFTGKVKISASSMQTTLETLTKLDFVYQDAGEYKVLDPAVETYLRQIYSDFNE